MKSIKNKFKKIISATSAVIALSSVSLTAFAEDAAATTTSGDTTPPSTGSPILYYGVMIGIFLLVGYFFLVRPEKKRKKEAEELRDNLRPGNRITTIGGIVGTVERVTDEEIYLTNGLVLKRWALRTIDQTADETSSAVTYYDEDDESSEGEDKQ
jgi:preprotein translocase subunit YajC